MPTVILQKQNGALSSITTREVNIIRTCAAINGGFTIVNSTIEDLHLQKIHLITGALPVGSVEFVQKAMELLHLKHPTISPYLISTNMKASIHEKPRFYARTIYWTAIKNILDMKMFVKPVKLKLFNGFVYDPSGNYTNDHDREQHDILMSLPKDLVVWVSEPVKWVREERIYLYHGHELGRGRYDDGPDDVPPLDESIINEIIPHCPPICSLDVGVLDTGETAIVEINDAWALGYYTGTLTKEDYFWMLWERWQEIRNHTAIPKKYDF